MGVESWQDTNRDWTSFLAGETLLLGTLGRILYTYPDRSNQDWFRSLIDEDVFSESPFAQEQPELIAGLEKLQVWSDANRQTPVEQTLEELRVDYTALFACAGEITAPPWESVYCNRYRMVLQEQTLQVRGWYRRFGLLARDFRREPDDHIGLELIFVAHLAGLALRAQEQGDPEAFDSLLDDQRRFLQEHLLRWAHLFSGQVELYARTDFYRGIAGVLRGAAAELSAAFQVELPEPVMH